MFGWCPELVKDGSRGSTYVQALQGDVARWDQWPEIRRCNPLTAISPDFRKKLLEERDAAREDTRLKSRFVSYRLNVPMGDESEVLLTVTDWERVERREVPDRAGRPIVGVDAVRGARPTRCNQSPHSPCCSRPLALVSKAPASSAPPRLPAGQRGSGKQHQGLQVAGPRCWCSRDYSSRPLASFFGLQALAAHRKTTVSTVQNTPT